MAAECDDLGHGRSFVAQIGQSGGTKVVKSQGAFYTRPFADLPEGLPESVFYCMSVADSLAKRFGFKKAKTDLRTEVIAGITTFLTMSYIVILNPAILGAAIQIDGYSAAQVTQMLAIVTLLSAGIACLVMAFYANRPFGLAPGL
mgnify:CR=1 FL=1